MSGMLFSYSVYVNIDREAAAELWERDVEDSVVEYGTENSGEIGMFSEQAINWKDEVQDDYQTARSYINKHHQVGQAPIGIPFTNPSQQMCWLVGGWCLC